MLIINRNILKEKYSKLLKFDINKLFIFILTLFNTYMHIYDKLSI
jgi:hypothetical protein